MTDYSGLLNAERIARGRFSRKQVQDCLRIARRDVKTATGLLHSSTEWTFNIAYNAMHQAGRAYLFHQGYRTVGAGHHATVVRFLEIALRPEFGDILAVMDRMRRKRNRATYDSVGTVSVNEAEEAITTARQFLAEITRRVKPA